LHRRRSVTDLAFPALAPPLRRIAADSPNQFGHEPAEAMIEPTPPPSARAAYQRAYYETHRR
jgi:hypothetical protein